MNKRRVIICIAVILALIVAITWGVHRATAIPETEFTVITPTMDGDLDNTNIDWNELKIVHDNIYGQDYLLYKNTLIKRLQ